MSDRDLKTQNEQYSGDPTKHIASHFFYEVSPWWSAAVKHLCHSIAFCVGHCHKKAIFRHKKDILEKGAVSQTFRYGYAIFLVCLTKSMQNPNGQLVHFSHLFRGATDCGLKCVLVWVYRPMTLLERNFGN